MLIRVSGGSRGNGPEESQDAASQPENQAALTPTCGDHKPSEVLSGPGRRVMSSSYHHVVVRREVLLNENQSRKIPRSLTCGEKAELCFVSRIMAYFI